MTPSHCGSRRPVCTWAREPSSPQAPRSRETVGSSATQNTGSVTGTLTQAQIQTIAGQGIGGATEFAEVAQAIRNLLAYANVHSSRFPGGEIRGQLVPGRLFGRD
jgi:hypothetical protein